MRAPPRPRPEPATTPRPAPAPGPARGIPGLGRALAGLALLLCGCVLGGWVLGGCAGVVEEEAPCVGVACGENRDCTEGERRCIGDRPQTCIGDGVWGLPRDCAGQCVNGSCQSPCPEGACLPDTVRCAPEGLQTCERREDGCGAFGLPVPCALGARCVDGACRADCASDCTPGERRCGSAAEVATCVVRDGCPVLEGTETCGGGTLCSDGDCLPPGACEDACPQGQVVCRDAAFAQRCERLPSGCLDWGDPLPCDAGQTCRVGEGCVQTCRDECAAGAVRCAEGGAQRCVAGPDGCEVWGAVVACAPGEACEAGACVDRCPGACVEGTARCSAFGREVCEVRGGCPTFVAAPCPNGQPCLGDGQCGDCRPGAFQEEDCGNCGVRTRTCDAQGRWGSFGACGDQGECAAGTQRACGNCGRQTCTAACTWGACEGGGACAPGETGSCNDCGTRTCNGQCQWDACGNGEGTLWRRCNACGWQFCCPDGDWCNCASRFECPGAQRCVNPGVCQ